MKLLVYLDTSVVSAYGDDRLPNRQAETVEFWARAADFNLSTSELAREELTLTPDPQKRKILIDLLKGLTIHQITDETRDLARTYIERGVFSNTIFNDSLHVAVAVLTRQDVLLSWNFKHLVNRRRRAKIMEVNVSLGLPPIEILAPPEIL
jgi:hypothetical protein